MQSEAAASSWRLAAHRAARAPDRRAERPAHRRLAASMIRVGLIPAVVISTNTYNEDLFPPAVAALQQYLGVALWIMIAGCAWTMQPLRRWRATPDAVAIVAFYGFAVASVAWSDLSFSSLTKAMALSITSFGAYCLATRLALDDIIDSIALGLFLLILTSIAMVIMLPAYGVDHTWQHEGKWQGIFASKQSLGIVGALLMFFSAYRFQVRRGWLRFLITFGAAVACVLGSESRGGGALALVACLSVYIGGRSAGVAKLLALAPAAMTCAALTLLGYFYFTGAAALDLFGTRIDFTERTLIWQYSLAHLDQHPLLGFGLNGFWTIEDIPLGYKRLHGWVLENFHSGYLTILMETGLVGFVLFGLMSFGFGVRMIASIESAAAPRPHIVVLIGYMILTYLIDFTETIFLRSTMFHSTLILVFLVCAALPDEQWRRRRA